MSDKKLYLCVEPSPDVDFDEWCYLINTEDKTWGSILENIENSLESGYIHNDEKFEGIKLNIEIKMMDPNDLMDVSDK